MYKKYVPIIRHLTAPNNSSARTTPYYWNQNTSVTFHKHCMASIRYLIAMSQKPHQQHSTMLLWERLAWTTWQPVKQVRSLTEPLPIKLSPVRSHS